MSARRPSRTHYYLGLAVGVAARAACTGQKVGAVLVRENRVISTGYNGTPEGFANCYEGSCPRCKDSTPFGGSGNGYDKCICVHAEMNAIAAAARYGMATDGATAYVTHQPCITCAKELAQAGVVRVFYVIPFEPTDEHVATQDELRFIHRQLMGQIGAVPVRYDAVAAAVNEAAATFAERAQPAYDVVPVATSGNGAADAATGSRGGGS